MATRTVSSLFPQVNVPAAQVVESASTNIVVGGDPTQVLVTDNTLEDNTSVGDFVEINGVEYTVTALDPMTGQVTLSSNDGTDQTANVMALPAMVDINFESSENTFSGNITNAAGDLGLNMTTGETVTFNNNDVANTNSTGPLFHLENGAADYIVVDYTQLTDPTQNTLPRQTTRVVTMTVDQYETLFPDVGGTGRQPDRNTLYLLSEDPITT